MRLWKLAFSFVRTWVIDFGWKLKTRKKNEKNCALSNKLTIFLFTGKGYPEHNFQMRVSFDSFWLFVSYKHGTIFYPLIFVHVNVCIFSVWIFMYFLDECLLKAEKCRKRKLTRLAYGKVWLRQAKPKTSDINYTRLQLIRTWSFSKSKSNEIVDRNSLICFEDDVDIIRMGTVRCFVCISNDII